MQPDFQAHEQVLASIRAHDPKTVADGPVNPANYLQAQPRLLWILRETNGGGDWDLRSFLSSDDALFGYPHWHATFGALAKLSLGLLQGLDEGSIAQLDARDAVSALRSVAVINVNKRGGASRVNWDSFPGDALEFSPYVDQQIDALAPDVILAAGTIDHLPDRFAPVVTRLKQHSIGAATLDSGTHIVKCYHTAQTTVTHHELYGRILRSLQEAGWIHPIRDNAG